MGEVKMSVKVKIPSILRQFISGEEVVEVKANDALECLTNLTAQFPSLRRWLYDKQGEPRPQVWIFINGEKINADVLANPLNDGDELLIMLAVAGG
jgi:molybdopterin converting factor small subunit